MRPTMLTSLVLILGAVGCKKEEPEPEPAEPPRTRSAEVEVVLEQVNDPLWALGDFAIFTAEIGAGRDITSVVDCIMEGHEQTWDAGQGLFFPAIEPYDTDPPPHDTMFTDALADCGWTSTRLLDPADLLEPRAVFLTFSILPDPDDAPEGFSVADVENAHPIIPSTFFPFKVDIDFLKDGELIEFTDDLTFPRLEDLGMNGNAQGMSAVPMLTFETESLLPPGQDTAGVFRWEIQVTDSRVHGWNATADIYLGEEAAGGPGYNGGATEGTTTEE